MQNNRIPLPDERFKHMLVRMPGSGRVQYTTAKIGESDYMAISDEWDRLRTYVLDRDEYKCRMCGSAINPEIHHIKYPEVWGEEDPNDLITLCHKCHEKIHQKDIERKQNS